MTMRTDLFSRFPLLLTTLLLGSCSVTGDLEKDTFRLNVSARQADEKALTGPDQPYCLDMRGRNPNQSCLNRAFLVTVEAINPEGKRDTSFNGYVRLDVHPGSVLSVSDLDGAEQKVVDGRNILLTNGVAPEVRVVPSGAFGDTRIIAEDIGYTPVDPLTATDVPSCSDGKDNDGDGFVDFPADPGCAYANDDSEESGSFAKGVSQSLYYQLPTLSESQGLGDATPYEKEAVSVDATSQGVNLIVTRVASSGFYVSDVSVTRKGKLVAVQPKSFGHLFVFNFGPPVGLRTCDKLIALSGTMTDRFGMTQLGFPSWDSVDWDFRSEADGGFGPCLIPEPTILDISNVLTTTFRTNDAELEKLESGLVRVLNARVAKYLGPNLPARKTKVYNENDACPSEVDWQFSEAASNCDLDGNGSVDFTDGTSEDDCACQCFNDPECSEFSEFQSRLNYRVLLDGIDELDARSKADATLRVNTSEISEFNPRTHTGQKIISLTGTLSNFSGGPQNWTIEARCSDDLLYCEEKDTECAKKPPTSKSSQQACVNPRIADDNDSETN